MSEVKALEELREQLDVCKMHGRRPTIAYMTDIANEIEAEIAERFMELPVDADSVPIHVGETVYGKYLEGNPEFTVRGFSFDLEHGQWSVQTSAATWTSANLLINVKPRTIEDVLADFAADVENDRNDHETARKYADEIRELMEAGR